MATHEKRVLNLVLNLLSLVLLGISNPVGATTYRTSFLKDIAMGLGDCHDPRNPTQVPLSSALSFEISVGTQREDRGISRTLMRVVRDMPDFLNALNIDVNLASALAEHGERPQILEGIEDGMGSDSACFVVSESRLYPVEEVKSPRPHCPSNHVTQFIEVLRSYPEIVVKQERGAAYFVLVCMRGISPSEKLQIETRLEAAAAAFEEAHHFPVEEVSSLFRKYENRDLSIRFESFGFDPFLELSVPSSFNQKAPGAYFKRFIGLFQSLQQSYSKASFETAIPVIFETEPTDVMISKMPLDNLLAYGAFEGY